MSDRELDEIFRENDRRIDELHKRFMAFWKQLDDERKRQEKTKLIRLGLREPEAEAWLDREIDYDKPIAETRHDDYAGQATDQAIRRKVTAPFIRRRLHRTQYVAPSFDDHMYCRLLIGRTS